MTSVKLDWSQVLGDQPQADNEQGQDFWNNVLGDQGPNYLQRTIANIPESAARVGHAMLHPWEDAAAGTAVGEQLKQSFREAPQTTPGSPPPGRGSKIFTGDAAANFVANLPSHLKTSLEKDPVGTAISVGALFVGGPEALAAKGVRTADEALAATRVASLPERIAKLPERPAPEAIAQTASQRAAALKAEAAAKMNVAKASEETLPTTGLEPIVANLKAKAAEEGYNPRLREHKSAKTLFKEFDALLPKEVEGPDMSAMMSRMAPVARASLEKKLAELTPEKEIPTTTLKEIHQLRQQIRTVSGSSDANARLIGGHMKDALDDFMSQFMEGKTMSEGIKQYARASWAQEIEQIAQKALVRRGQSTQQGYDQIFRTEFANLARNDKKMRMLRAVSPQAADKVTQLAGGGTALTKVLKGLGTTAPRGVMSFTLDNVAGHLFHAIGMPIGPVGIMAVGTGAKYLGGKLAQESIEDIMNTIMNAPKVETLQKVVGGPSVFEKLMQRPRTAQAIRNWAGATGDRKRIATIALTSAIAKEVNRPDLQQRIQQELDNIDREHETVMPKTQQAMQ